MSEKSLDQQDIKKICLICGCHTNQAINIYEPRSGPNIIELIQAKFKFQPVNEDKFLCFSCNNWLINWHSLQVLNTKESDENHSSGKSRLNNSIPEEESENNFDEMLTAVNIDKYELYDEKSLKPIQNKPKTTTTSYHSYLVRNSAKKRKSFYISRRFVSSWNKIRKTRRKSMQLCSLCGHASLKLQTSLNKCKNCRKILKWRAAYYLKTMIEEEKRKFKNIQQLIKPDETTTTEILQEYQKNLNLVTPIGSSTHYYLQQHYYNYHQQHQHNNMRNQRPLVDGKVVAMLRRLGTTLTREGNEISANSPIIMSPAKKKPQKPIWRKSNINNPNVKDDILIDFNTVISEVLPMVKIVTATNTQTNNKTMETNIEERSDIDDDEMKPNLKEIYSKIPKCVTVSVINVAS